jgi:transcriptional regulator with GAF, ATPase, and Fis domain/serine/threonine protein kinase
MVLLPERYRLISEIACGQDRLVLKCFDSFENKEVAVKVWLTGEENVSQSVQGQFDLLANIEHPHLVRALDSGFDSDGFPYLATEWTKNRDITSNISSLTATERKQIIIQLTEALDFLHSSGYIHGDIKPNNALYFPGDNGKLLIKLTDFEFLEPGEYVSPKMWKGTPAYMAPEVIRGEPVSFSSDLYSLGVLAFELLTGRLPFKYNNIYDLAYAQLDEEIDISEQERKSLSPALLSCIHALLHKNPVERPSSVWKIRDALIHDKDRIMEADKLLGFHLSDYLCRLRLGEKISEDDINVGLRDVFPGADANRKFSRYLMEKSGGDLNVLNGLLKELIDVRMLCRDQGKWRVSHETEDYRPRLSFTRKFIKEDSGSMETHARKVLEMLSIFRNPVEYEILKEIVDVLPDVFDHTLQTLVTSEWIMESENRSLRFRKGFCGDHLLHTLNPESIVRMRKQVLGHLESKLTGDCEAVLLQEILFQARALGESELTFRYALRLADLFEEHGEKEVVLYYASLARENIAGRNPEQDQLALRLADLYNDLGKPKEAIQYYSQYPLSSSANSGSTAQAERKLGMCYARLSHFEDAFKHFDSAMDYYRHQGDEKGIVEVLLDSAVAKRIEGDYVSASQLLDQCEVLLKDHDEPILRARFFNQQGILAWYQGKYDRSINYLKQSLELFESLGITREIGRVANNIGLLLRDWGKPSEALSYMQKDLEVARELGDLVSLSATYNNLGLVYNTQNRFDKAISCFEQALKISHDADYGEGVGLAHNNLGYAYISMGLLDKALFHLREAVSCFRMISKKSWEALAYFNLGEIYRIRKLSIFAEQHYQLSLEIRRGLGEKLGIADSLSGLARLYLENRQLSKAETYYGEAIALFEELGKVQEAALLKCCKAEVYLDEKRKMEAEILIESLSKDDSLTNFPPVQSHISLLQGLIGFTKNDNNIAEQYLLEALRSFAKIGDKVAQARVNAYLGDLYSFSGEDRQALRHRRESLGIYRELKVDKEIEKLSLLIKETSELMSTSREQVRTLARVSQFLMEIEDEDELLFQSLQSAIELLGAERGAFILFDESRQVFEVKVSVGIETSTAKDAIEISRKTVKEVHQTGKIFISGDALSEPSLREHESIRTHNILSILCAPLRTDEKVIGAIYLDNRSVIRAFTDDDKDFIDALSNLIAVAIAKAHSFRRIYEEIHQLREQDGTTYSFPAIIGKSLAMQEVFSMVARVAPTKATVLIQGENGTGKELIAGLIHQLSNRKTKPYVRVNCAAIPDPLLESELFGVEEKVATGVGFREGKFRQSDGGTIFLDEVGDMSLATQAKVLRVLQEREFERVGGSRTLSVDVRVIAATNKDLLRLIKENLFRQDLYYRLNAVMITIPPLRERREDIPHLIEYFLKKFCEENDRPSVSISPETIQSLCEHNWPGNVRQLMNTIQRGVIFEEQGRFGLSQLPSDVGDEIQKLLLVPWKAGKLTVLLKRFEKQVLSEALKKTNWNQTKAANILGIPVSTLTRKMQRFGIKRPKTF